MPSSRVCLFRIVLSVCTGFEFGLLPALAKNDGQPAGDGGASRATVDFNRDVRPILSDTCFTCHGPDDGQRQTDMRLDTEGGMFAKIESGGAPIVPGDSASSLVYQRITAEDEFERMPPADSGKSLANAQIALIKQWIDQGAESRQHWSLVAPERPVPPAVSDDDAVHNSIDRFVINRLMREKQGPSLEAEPTTLIRRVTFDLTGLPPALDDVDDFLADDSPDAYFKVVDRLLASPHYGEHRARFWLDAARYGDTHGLHLDNVRSMWPYRDWVVRAFNRNQPFDEFTVWQLAGDLLPEASLDHKIATGFNRCNVTTSEGGSIPEEYRVRYAVDRVETLSTVWMGLTMGCAVCHDHKFDPLSQRDFYRMFAYYSRIEENPMDGNALLPPPSIKVPTPEYQEQKGPLEGRLAEVRQRIRDELAKIEYVDPHPEAAGRPRPREEYVWIDDALPSGVQPATSGAGQDGWQFVSADEHPVFSGEKSSTRTAQGNSQHFFTGASPGLRIGEGDVLFAHVWLDEKNPPREIMLQFNDGTWDHRAVWGEDLIDWGQTGKPSRRVMGPLPERGQWVRLEVAAARVGLKPGAVLNGWAFTQYDGTVYWDKAGLVTATPQDGSPLDSLAAWIEIERGRKESSLPAGVREAVLAEPGQRTAEQTQQVQEYFVEHVYSGARATFKPLHEELAAVEKQLDELERSLPATLIMDDMDQPHETFVLKRGQYDQPDKDRPVDAGVPAVFPPLPEDAPSSRLALARWLVRDDHPLTARVTVNRFWQQYFGTAIVKTAEDFGSQGEWPSHPELLDWLARDFIESGWNVKRMQTLVVTSATYRQSSHATPAQFRRDPENRLLARGPRHRLDAEMIRDQALAASGILVRTFGGESVKPYQPPGLWEAVGYTDSNTAKFVQDHGEKLYRRSVYTFWKRTAHPPTMAIFDAPSREACTVRRERTNTPMQALVLMNDIQFVEAARHLAERMLTEAGPSPEERITIAFRLATARAPDAEEMQVFLDVYREQLAGFRKDPEAAVKLLTVGESPRNDSLDAAEHAAWTMVANLILNLDEVVTKG